MDRQDAGEPQHLPSRLIAIAAVNGIREHAFHDCLINNCKENARGRTVVEHQLSVVEIAQNRFPLALTDVIEELAVCLHAMTVRGRDAGAIKSRRRKRKLIALTRHTGFPRSLHIQAVAFSPAAG